MNQKFSSEDVAITSVPAIPVAIMEHRGDPATIGATIQRFIAWRKAAGLRPAASATYNVFHSDPRTSPRRTIVSTCVSAPTARSNPTPKASPPASSPAAAARWCG